MEIDIDLKLENKLLAPEQVKFDQGLDLGREIDE